MQRGFKLTKILKISCIAYSVLTIVFFLLTNLAAGFVGAGKTDGIYGSCILIVNLLLYVELFGYVVIFGMALVHLYRTSQFAKGHQPVSKEEKFPTLPFVISLVFFLIFMSLINAVLA